MSNEEDFEPEIEYEKSENSQENVMKMMKLMVLMAKADSTKKIILPKNRNNVVEYLKDCTDNAKLVGLDVSPKIEGFIKVAHGLKKVKDKSKPINRILFMKNFPKNVLKKKKKKTLFQKMKKFI